jgi:hypothetical protein
MPTYLESSHPQNRPIYEKLGFHYVKTIYMTRAVGEEHIGDEGKEGHGEYGKGIALEIMVREPRKQEE